MQGVLKAYEIISGQAINFSKSSIAFSRNVDIEEQMKLAALVGMQRVAFHETYLGAPVSIGRKKSDPFRHLVDRARKRTESWSARALSAAGREVLIKSVIQAIPSYLRNIFEIPESIISEIHGITAKYWWGGSSAKPKMHWIKWQKLCENKRVGGMGFRDLRAFNLALLAKQGWRLMQNPDSIVAMILKAKYYPTCSFMEASIPPNASFTWRSIANGRKVLELGLRYRVGNGDNVRMWHDRWLPIPYGFKTYTRPPDDLADVTVDYFIEGGSWVEERLRECLSETEVVAIMQIPLSITRVEDVLMWHIDRRGIYSVRSGYWTYMEYLSRQQASGSGSSSSQGMESVWRGIWNLEVPPKVRVFMWRIIQGIIPTKQALTRRHVKLDSVDCVFCKEDAETVEHVLRDCAHAGAFWTSSPMHQQPALHRHSHVSLTNWVIGVLEELQQEQASMFCMLLWSLWKQRNQMLWNGDGMDVHTAISFTCSQFELYKKTHRVKRAGSKRDKIKWQCPPSGRLKMNIDGAFIEERRRGGVGVIVRDDVGVGIAAIARPYEYAMSPFAMEMLALRDGLRLATQQGWSNFIIESDSILLISAMNGRIGDLSGIGTVIADCLRLSDDINGISYVHINREANQVADRLASAACGRGVDQVWFEAMPFIIHDAILVDSVANNYVAQGSGITPPLEQICVSGLINDREEGMQSIT